MSQTPQSSHQRARPGFPPAAPNNSQDKVQDALPEASRAPVSARDTPPTAPSSRVSFPGPPHSNDSWASTQDLLPSTRGHRVSFQGPPPASERASAQDTPPSARGRRVSFQSSLASSHSRRASVPGPPAAGSQRLNAQDTPPTAQTRRVSFQSSLASSHSRRASVPGPLAAGSLQVSAQDTQPILRSPRTSVQASVSIIPSPRVSFQDQLPASSRWGGSQSTRPPGGHQASAEDLPPSPQSRQVSFQDTPPFVLSRQRGSQNFSPIFQARLLSQANTEPAAYSSNVTSHSLQKSAAASPVSTKATASTSLIPRPSSKSLDKDTWSPQKAPTTSEGCSQPNQVIPEAIQGLPLVTDSEASSGRPREDSRRTSQLPIGWRLLHEARKISHQVSLALGLAGIVLIGLISLGQPWLHFEVPLRPAGDPAGPLTFPIDTVLFMRCIDMSCLHEYDHNAYLLDFACAFLLIASIASVCLCMLLINIMFFTSSNPPILNFSSAIFSILAGVCVMLGSLFYLMQAQQFLQEGMTYKLGRSFYLAWIGIFFFLMTGFLSYLNYTNFWSVLALPAVWT